MSTMPGNPHAESLTRTGYTTETPEYAATCQVEAILALAYEKRTESIIALAALCTANGRKELGEPFIELASERLGLDGAA